MGNAPIGPSYRIESELVNFFFTELDVYMPVEEIPRVRAPRQPRDGARSPVARAANRLPRPVARRPLALAPSTLRQHSAQAHTRQGRPQGGAGAPLSPRVPRERSPRSDLGARIHDAPSPLTSRAPRPRSGRERVATTSACSRPP